MTTTSPAIDLSFPIVQGLTVPIDHGHQLFGAIKTAAPQLAEITLGIHPLRGTPLPQGLLHLSPRSPLKIRLAADRIPAALGLAGKELRVGSMLIRLGSPAIQVLEPHAELYARTVVVVKSIKKEDRGDNRANRACTDDELIAHVKKQCNHEASVRILRWRTIRLHGKSPSKDHIFVKGAEIVIEV
jgi:CRISPR-associated protein Cas6